MNKAVKSQTLKLMFYTMLAFSVLFAVFALLVYFQISNSLFNPVHSDLIRAQEHIEGNTFFMESQLNFHEFIKPKPKNHDLPPQANNLPFRVTAVVRDAEENIVNQNALGRFSWDDDMKEIPVSNKDNMYTFQTISTSEGGYYESYIFTMNYDENIYNIQLLANVNGEREVLDNIAKYLIVGSIICVILAIAISFVLTRYSIKPIIASWERQSEFVENASHELRTPLTIIQNKLENMLTVPNETILENSQSIAVVLSETQRLSRLTTDLMTLARSDSGETIITMEAFFIDSLISKICEPYTEIASFQDKTMTLNLSYSDVLNADKLRIHELLVILLDNAIKYTNSGDHIEIHTYKKQGNFVLKVKDSGIGISESNYKKVFQRFYREDTARALKSNSSGLGLSIGNWIVTQHSGNISIVRKDEITTVKVVLPS